MCSSRLPRHRGAERSEIRQASIDLAGRLWCRHGGRTPSTRGDELHELHRREQEGCHVTTSSRKASSLRPAPLRGSHTGLRAAPRFQRGDSNADGAFNISDPVGTLGFLFLGAPAALPLAGPDAFAGFRGTWGALVSLQGTSARITKLGLESVSLMEKAQKGDRRALEDALTRP